MAWQEYIPHAIGGSAASGGLVLFVFKDAIKSWMEDRRKAAAFAREERAIERGKGSNLENKLLQILEKDLAGNQALLARLNDTMSDFRDIAKRQAFMSEDILVLMKETRESQKWLERKFGGAPS